MFGFFKKKVSANDIADILDLAQEADEDIYFWRTASQAMIAVYDNRMEILEGKLPKNPEAISPSMVTLSMVREVEQTGSKIRELTSMLNRHLTTHDMNAFSRSFLNEVIEYLKSNGDAGIAAVCEDNFSDACERFRRGYQKRTAVLKESGINA